MRRLCALLLACGIPALSLAGGTAAAARPRALVLHTRYLHGVLVLLPSWYGPHRHPRLPVVIAPHLPQQSQADVVSFWRDLPDRGGFAVLSPVGGSVAPQRIEFLARVRKYATLARRWLDLDPDRIYGFGSGRIGRELLLLAARYPWSVAGVAALEPTFELAAADVRRPQVRRARSFLDALAAGSVPIQLWSAAGDDPLYDALKRANRHAHVVAGTGVWTGAGSRLPVALLGFGLLQPPGKPRPLFQPAFLGAEKPVGPGRLPGAGGCGTTAGRLSYGWPVAPFDEPHPIRGDFGDPRTVFRLSSPDDPHPHGTFSFHNGVDIVADADTPVYPVVSGVAQAGGDEVDVRTPDGRLFRYIHIAPQVTDGDLVVRDRTILGTVLRRYGHVHLSESRDGRVVNPLMPGHLTPWLDDTAPEVASVELEDGSGEPVDPQRLSGGVDVVAEAYDAPPLAVPGRWYGMPLVPVLIGWRLATPAGNAVLNRVAVDFRRTIPDEEDFYAVYARGTYQNFPAIGLHYFAKTPGRYLFDLTPGGLDTRQVPAGDYDLTVKAADTCGNVGSLTTRVRVLPQPGQVRPAPPPAPAPPVAAAKPQAEPAPAPVGPISWPQRTSGYTVVLASVPREEGSRVARRQAKAAMGNGVPQVGVLDARRFHGLDGRFRVVFSGVYPDAAAAEKAAETLSGAYPEAYVRQIVPPPPPLARWPAGHGGWTVVLASVPDGRGARAAARAKAAQASDEGLPRVGVLDTDRFRSVKPGYLVVFSGEYRTQAEAQAAAHAAASHVPSAYAREIAPRGS